MLAGATRHAPALDPETTGLADMLMGRGVGGRVPGRPDYQESGHTHKDKCAAANARKVGRASLGRDAKAVSR